MRNRKIALSSGSQSRNLTVIALSLIGALALTMAPLPYWTWQPAWLLLLVIYFSSHSTVPFGLGMAWCTGLMLDFLSDAPTGQNAMLFMLCAFIVQMLSHQSQVFRIGLQQYLLVLLITTAYLLAVGLFELAIENRLLSLRAFLPAISSTIIWSLFSLALSLIVQKIQVD